MRGSAATEVRCQEKSGGLAYEVILSTPTVDPPASVTSPAAKPAPTADDISRRLQAAEQRKKVGRAPAVAPRPPVPAAHRTLWFLRLSPKM